MDKTAVKTLNPVLNSLMFIPRPGVDIYLTNLSSEVHSFCNFGTCIFSCRTANIHYLCLSVSDHNSASAGARKLKFGMKDAAYPKE